MALTDALLSIVALVLPLALILAACLSYVLFAELRRVSAALAGATAGLVVGSLVGVGLPVVGGTLVGGLAGFAVADGHPRGGTVAVAGGTGLSLGAMVAASASGGPALADATLAGVVLAAALLAVGWRFPRAVLLPGLSAVLGVFVAVLGMSVGGSLSALGQGTLVGASPFADEGAAMVLVAPFTFLLFGVLLQPFLVEYTDRVPPLLPGWLRRLLQVKDASQDVPEGARPPCPECGTIRDPGHDACPSCGASTDAEYALPDDVVAVDVPCPHCGDRPVREVATAHRVTGLLLAYRLHTERHVGCHDCVRRECFRAAKVTALTGWFSVSCLLLNPVMIARNVLRGLYDAGPSRALLGVLDDAGLEYDLLRDADAFDPERADESAVVEGLVRLGAAVMLAEGGVDRDAAERLHDAVLAVADGYDADEVTARIKAAVEADPDVDAVAEGLADALTLEGRELALEVAREVATAGDARDGGRPASIDRVAAGLDLDEPEAVAVERYTGASA